MLKKRFLRAFVFFLFILSFLPIEVFSLIEFVNDTLLDLPGLSENVYIQAGSQAENLEISGNVFRVFGVPDGNSFVLKTAGAIVLNLTPSGGSLDFEVSSEDFAEGTFKKWQVNTLVSTTHLIGGLAPNTKYTIYINDTKFGTFTSNGEGEISFTRTGGGNETFKIVSFYGLDLEYGLTPREIKGFAWGNMVSGWISFNRVNCDSNQNGLTDTGNYVFCPVGEEISDYRVFTKVLFIRAINLTSEWHYCKWEKAPILKWETRGGNQSRIQLQISTSTDFASPVFDTGEIDWFYQQYPAQPEDWAGKTWTLPHPQWNQTYHWQLKVGDSEGNWSPWAYGGTFTLPAHKFAKAAFDWKPSSPSKGEEVQFQNLTDYDPSYPVTWAWTIEPLTGVICINTATCICPDYSICFEPRVRFDVIESKTITLRATTDLPEEDLYSGRGCGPGCCQMIRNLNVQYPLPIWKEVIPK